MKKFLALMAALMMLLAMVPAAMAEGEATTPSTAASAYTAVKPSANTPPITHTLTLTEENATALPYEITYSFAVAETATIMQPSGVINSTNAVEGAPTIAPITYGPDDTFGASNKACTKSLEIDWSAVSIKEPGVYRWTVTKTETDNDANEDPTNSSTTTYLYAYAIDNAGTLTIDGVGLTSAEGLDDATAKGNLGDSYPAKTLDLSISKTVAGNLGSKNQYFKFTLQLTSPAGAAERTYTISGHDAEVPATAYNEAKTNVTTITVPGGSTASVALWLKHNQTVTIKDIIFGTAYTITESENAGYDVDAEITGDSTGSTVAADTAEASDTALQVSTNVAYTNTKEAVTPTGINLNTAAPVMGLMLAMSLLGILFISKRKEAAK